jgi:FAD/FMN-containing dehydrogenase
MVSMNSGSSRSFRYGRMENWVEEAEFIDGTGRSQCLKGKDICGTEGGLGLITKIKLKLADRITAVSYELFGFDELEPLIEKVAMLRNRTDVLSIEFINNVASQVCLFGDKNYLLIEYEGRGGVIIKDEIKNLLDKRLRMKFLLFNAGYKILQDPKIPINNLVEFLYWIKMNKVPCFGHIGNGVMHAAFKDLEKIKPMYVTVNRLGGEVNGELGIGLLNKEFLRENAKSKFLKLKTKFDPENIINKGKIV